MSCLFFLMAFVNTIIDSLKDSLVITAVGGGTEVRSGARSRADQPVRAAPLMTHTPLWCLPLRRSSRTSRSTLCCPPHCSSSSPIRGARSALGGRARGWFAMRRPWGSSGVDCPAPPPAPPTPSSPPPLPPRQPRAPVQHHHRWFFDFLRHVRRALPLPRRPAPGRRGRVVRVCGGAACGARWAGGHGAQLALHPVLLRVRAVGRRGAQPALLGPCKRDHQH